MRVLHAIRDDVNTSAIMIGDQERLLADNRNYLRRFFVYTWRDAMVDDWERILKDLKGGREKDLVFVVAWARRRLHDIKNQVKGLIDDELQSTASKIEKGFKEVERTKRNSSSVLGDEIPKLVKQLKKWDEREIVETLLAEANIIFCTLSSAGAQVMKETVAVDDAIVDEAAAATGPELCIGLWLVNGRLLLVGDPNQLPAAVSSDYGKQHGLDKSLQDRLMNQCDFAYTMLDIQYRMKPEISEFPFKTFYSGNVSNGDNVEAFSYQPDASLLNCQPYSFLQVQAVEQRDFFGSWYNIPECDVVIGLLQDLRQRSRHVGHDWSNVEKVRVITFYQAQVITIRKRLQRFGLQNVMVSTVDSSQGCEADIIIISFVRNDRVGFLSDFRRLNVALTRAKHQLICVGNAKTLATLTSEKAQVVSKLAQDALARKCVVTNYRSDRQPLRNNDGHKKKGKGDNRGNRNARSGGKPDNNWKKRNFAQNQRKNGRNDNDSRKKTKQT